MAESENLSGNLSEDKSSKKRNAVQRSDCGVGGGIYGLAFLGAAIYFISHATSFWMGVLGFLKAIVWPAILIYKLLEFLKL